jgi:hypothetical protein
MSNRKILLLVFFLIFSCFAFILLFPQALPARLAGLFGGVMDFIFKQLTQGIVWIAMLVALLYLFYREFFSRAFQFDPQPEEPPDQKTTGRIQHWAMNLSSATSGIYTHGARYSFVRLAYEALGLIEPHYQDDQEELRKLEPARLPQPAADFIHHLETIQKQMDGDTFERVIERVNPSRGRSTLGALESYIQVLESYLEISNEPEHH